MTYEDDSTSVWGLEGPVGEESPPNLPTVVGSEDTLADRSSAKTTGTSGPDPDLGLGSEHLPGPGLSTSSRRAEKPVKEPGGGGGGGAATLEGGFHQQAESGPWLVYRHCGPLPWSARFLRTCMKTPPPCWT